eukprot:CAMPEP_0184292664 /NCGR_PEP_ID=MMETSP1049-20130417/4390_1 /TAXON_ID=77928 /ORGANISM="Proteomonas sulcata, Strain CCMP704" /LENGTH=39 /DNA_ID= /DNA_START= /DNA_END= /DNA_ORIENTATION=
MEELTKTWRPYRSPACWYMWRKVNTAVPAGKKGPATKKK